MTITSVVRIHPLLLAFLCSGFPAVAAEKVRDNREMTRRMGVDLQNVLAETPIRLA